MLKQNDIRFAPNFTCFKLVDTDNWLIIHTSLVLVQSQHKKWNHKTYISSHSASISKLHV